jgi:hypothetical protein
MMMKDLTPALARAPAAWWRRIADVGIPREVHHEIGKLR